MSKSNYVGDFETTTDATDCRVWSWGLYDILEDTTITGHTIDEFFEQVYTLPNKSKIYFHNLKFDGQFMMYYLFNNGYKHSSDRMLYHKQFNTLITDTGVWYQVKICYEGRYYTFMDSYKIIPMSVSAMSEAFGIEQIKGDIDYKMYRPVGYQMTELEKEYVINDCVIVGKALLFFFSQGLTKMTQASNAFNDLKTIIGKKNFRRWFPILKMDKELRQSYKGGFTYVSPKYQGKTIGKGIVLDVNSLYPYVMLEKKLPYGHPIYFEGKYEDGDKDENELYDLSIQMFRCSFELKDKHIPTIQMKGNLSFIPTEYVTTTGGEDYALCLTSVDLKLFLDHYDVYNVEWFGGWKFKSDNEIMGKFIEKWNNIKVECTHNGNLGLRLIAKLMMNASYGKYALNPNVVNKYPVFDGEFVKYKKGVETVRDPIYLPVASFITAYAREITIRSAQKNYDRFIYADTDSIHLLGTDIPTDLEIDNAKIGAWKIEYYFDKARFVRQKSYIENALGTYVEKDGEQVFKYSSTYDEGLKGKLHIACAGLPKTARGDINFDNFKDGLIVQGKLAQKSVKGGVILQETTFEMTLNTT